jgi:hypothetical protein
MAGVKGKAGNFKTKANLVKALQKNLITGAEYKAALPIVEEYEAARAEAYAYGVIKSNNEMTSIGGDLYNYNLQNDTTKTALAKAYGGYKEDVQTQYETLPASVQNVINWLKNRNTLYKAEIADLKTKRNKVKAISPAMLRSYDALSDAKKKKSEVKTLYIDNGVFTDADVKAYIKAEDLVETHAKKANAYRAQLISLGYNQTNMQPFLGNDKTALLTQMLPTNGDFSTIKRYATGGYVMPQKFVQGGYAVGTDTVPAMLTPGEFIVSQPAVKSFGTDNLKAINNGTYGGESVYNYSISVSVQSGADPDQIAQAVMTQIKQADSQRVRGNNF